MKNIKQENLENKNIKRLKIFLFSLLMIILLLSVSFLIFVSDYYKADSTAIQLTKKDEEVEVLDNLAIISPADPSDTAIIFYPGAKVEFISYIPILEKLKENGIASILIKMPFNMAIFNANAADTVFDLLPNTKNWYIGGHSMGGAMASRYASKNQDKVKGLILLGSYIYGDYPPKNTLTVYGTLNSDIEKNIDYTENILVIDGGNHAQFGNYGKQKNDPLATISQEKQQNIAVDAILDFIGQ
ncbi:MAG: alpha/beta fold hydrolase [Clostridium sp.]|nr:alpha/beta fold hydrolase [Clostridium sp.]